MTLVSGDMTSGEMTFRRLDRNSNDKQDLILGKMKNWLH